MPITQPTLTSIFEDIRASENHLRTLEIGKCNSTCCVVKLSSSL